jgi:hypothetical protein
MISALDERIAWSMEVIRRRQIFYNATAMIACFGEEHSCKRRGICTVRSMCVIAVGPSVLRITEGPVASQPDALEVKIFFSGTLVFHAVRAREYPITDDPRRIIKQKSGLIVIEMFRKGAWLQWMGVARMKRELALHARAYRDSLRIAEAADQNLQQMKVRMPDKELARRFGL